MGNSVSGEEGRTAAVASCQGRTGTAPSWRRFRPSPPHWGREDPSPPSLRRKAARMSSPIISRLGLPCIPYPTMPSLKAPKEASSSCFSSPSSDADESPSSSSSPFDAVPSEVLLRVFALCPAASFPQLRAVCRGWREHLLDPWDLSATRRAQGREEQWIAVASSEGEHEPFRLRLRAFHCQTRHWHHVALPKPLAHLGPGFGLATIGHKLYLVGGSVGKFRTPTAATWCYDLFSMQWELRARMVTPRRFHAMGAVNGRLVVAGGEVPGGYDFCLSEVYDPATNSWHEIPDTALPARSQEGWVVKSSMYVRHLPDRVYEISLPETRPSSPPMLLPCQLSVPAVLEGALRAPGDGPSLVEGIPHWTRQVRFRVAPYKKQADPMLAGMDHIVSSNHRVYGCMLSSRISSIGVFNERSRGWHVLIGNDILFHRMFERFEGMVCGGGCLFVITKDTAVLQIVMEDRGKGLGGPEWCLISKGSNRQARWQWRRFACLEF